MVERKRKKHHDKDKYYRLAKEQGLRSRAAFKLGQINRKYPLLEKCTTAVLDLCAAPGGWTQIAARTCPKSVAIVAVDILPIRKLAAFPNITTIVGDITTDKCKSDIQRAVQKQTGYQHKNRGTGDSTGIVDVVLHDGAPNVGADYSKDAYEQNELSLHALKCATQHLKHGGHFVTKLYRSKDYQSYVWVLQQLFEEVIAFKPKASRTQSAEIFMVAKNYKLGGGKKDKIDPRFLDPKHVFASVGGDSTGGSMRTAGANAAASTLSVFSKTFEKRSKSRNRGGYDMDHLDATMRHVEPISKFVMMPTLREAIGLLASSTGFCFSCPTCNKDGDDLDPAAALKKLTAAKEEQDCYCKFMLSHPLTTQDIKECASDLQLLNKGDFKELIMWRSKMLDGIEAKKEREKGPGGDDEEVDDDDDDDSDDEEKKEKLAARLKKRRERAEKGEGGEDDDDDLDSEEEEAQVLKEIEEMRQRRAREKKRKKKKERAAAAKRRQRDALGLDINIIDISEHDKVFSLATITSKKDLDAAAEVNLDRLTDDQVIGGDGDSDSDSDIYIPKEKGSDEDDGSSDDGNDDDSVKQLKRREEDMERAYDMYLAIPKVPTAGTKMAKRSKKASRNIVLQEALEDVAMVSGTAATVDHDTLAYAKMLRGPRDSDDSSDDDDGKEDKSDDEDDDDDDGFKAEPMTPEEFELAKSEKKKKERNPLIHQFDEPASDKTARWFSNPVFTSIGQTAEAAISKKKMNLDQDDDDDSSADGDDEDSEASSDEVNAEKIPKGPKKKKKKIGLDAEEVFASIPKTMKELRHEKRLKNIAREERKKEKRAKKAGLEETDFEIAPSNQDGGKNDQLDESLANLTESQRKKVLKARELIKAGMGNVAACDDRETSKGFETVPQSDPDRPLPIMDQRKYDSENEEYDSDDYAKTLALGTMMLRRSKEKAFVDASYNRYAWNDPANLPEWFTDDERQYYRPQLPIPPALVAKMKERMLALSVKPIAKVAEARARKSRRAKAKLQAAKKKAEAISNSTDMTEAMKLKAISKALRSQEAKKPGKKVVVATKGRPSKARKGVKVVDKRMKSDKRGMERAEKRGKGSKKKRH